jgi:hypothetical protein
MILWLTLPKCRFKDAIERKKLERRKKKKEDLYEDTQERKKTDFRRKKKDKLYESTKERRRSQRTLKDKKKTRMGKCLTIVPLSIASFGIDEAMNYVIDYFSEEFVLDDQLLDYWPTDVTDVPEADLESPEFIDMYASYLRDWKEEVGVDTQNGANKIIKRFDERTPLSLSNNTGMIVSEHMHEKRFWPIIIAIASFVARFAQVAARVAVAVTTRLGRLLERGGARLAQGSGRVSRQELRDTAGKTSRNNNWRNCLLGKGPQPRDLRV